MFNEIKKIYESTSFLDEWDFPFTKKEMEKLGKKYKLIPHKKEFPKFGISNITYFFNKAGNRISVNFSPQHPEEGVIIRNFDKKDFGQGSRASA